MSGPDDPTLSQERAQAVWRRAARLQAEAERRMEERARALAAAEGARAAEDVPVDGFRATDVEAAAVEAGIAPEYVRIALAEVGAAEPQPAPLRPWEERAATRFLGAPDRSVELVRVVPGALPRVLDTALRVLAGHPCLLQVREVADLPSLPGRLVAFDVPKYDWGTEYNPPFVGCAYTVGLRRVHLAVRALPGESAACEVVVSADLERGVRANWRWGALTSLGLGTAGTAVGALTVLPLLPLAGLGAVAAGITAAAWGPVYRYCLRQVVESLEEALRALEASLRATTDPHALSPGEG